MDVKTFFCFDRPMGGQYLLIIERKVKNMSLSFMQFGEESFSGELKSIKMRFKKDEVGCEFNTSPQACANSGNLYEVVKLITGNSDRKCFIGEIASGYVVELFSKDANEAEVVKVTFDKNRNVLVKGATIDTTLSSVVLANKYVIYEKATGVGYKGTAVLVAAVLKLIKDNSDIKDAFDAVAEYAVHKDDDKNYWNTIVNGEAKNQQDFAIKMAKFSDYIYRNITDRGANNADIRLYMPEKNRPDNGADKSNTMRNLAQGDLKTKVKDVIIGTASYFTSAKSNSISLTDFSLETQYSDKEKLLIPNLDGLDIPEWTKSAAKYCKLSSKYAEPIRTFFFVGPAGCGKSMGSRILSGLLGLVYDIITCNPDMEIFDFIGQIYPNTTNKALDFNGVRREMGLPSVSDIMMDPDSSFIKIYKRKPTSSVDEGELIETMINLVNKRVAKRLEGKDYKYVEGPLTKAIRYGYAVEIQEIGIVKRAGVAVGLNALLETGRNAFITLPTGETLKKHKNAVIIFTSNNGYVGTANLNQSVLSRMGDVRYFQNEKVDVMVERTLKVVHDFYSKEMLKTMAKVIQDINEYCQDKGIDDGVCGQRELNNWAIEIMCDLEDLGETEATADIIRECAQRTVINKVSQDEEAIAEVATGCIDATFGECSMYE